MRSRRTVSYWLLSWSRSLTFTSDIEKVREEARQKESRYLEIISHYEEELKKYKEELNIYQRREEETKGAKENILGLFFF